MTSISLYETMFEANVRIESAWPFPMANVPDELIEAIENMETLPDELLSLIANWSQPNIDDLYSGRGLDSREAWDELSSYGFRKKIHGWIGIAATPVLTTTSENSASFSWGYYHTKLLFGASGDALIQAAIIWAESLSNKAYADFKAQEGKANG